MMMIVVGRISSGCGIGFVYGGNCTTANRLDKLLHPLIGFLLMDMLSAFKYCMQLQAPPTRNNAATARN